MKNNINYIQHICICCGQQEVVFYEICDICSWQDDPVQNDDPDFAGGANELSLNEYKKQW